MMLETKKLYIQNLCDLKFIVPPEQGSYHVIPVIGYYLGYLASWFV